MKDNNEMEKYYRRKNFWHDVKKGVIIGFTILLFLLAIYKIF